MQLKGKIAAGIIGIFVGDLLGLPFGGFIGFIVGSVIGHLFFDKPIEIQDSERDMRNSRKRQGEFIYHTMILCARLAKSDGPVNNQELKFVSQLMQDFRLNDKGRSEAIRVWNQAKDNAEPFEYHLRLFYNNFGKEQHRVNEMIILLFALAASDGSLHRREEEYLLRASGVFRLNPLQYERFKGRYYETTFEQVKKTPLDSHYSILGATPADSMDAIKKKFRALAMQWHPDKLTAKGASPEALRHAKEKFQKITEAYERISDARSKI